jgi:hypothetical protein
MKRPNIQLFSNSLERVRDRKEGAAEEMGFVGWSNPRLGVQYREEEEKV